MQRAVRVFFLTMHFCWKLQNCHLALSRGDTSKYDEETSLYEFILFCYKTILMNWRLVRINQ